MLPDALIILSILISFAQAAGHTDSSGKAFTFVGDQHWSETFRQQCDQPNNLPYKNKDLKCYTYMIELHTVNVELLSTDPLLIVYRNFANPYEIKCFLDYVASQELIKQGVQDAENVTATNFDSARIANGTWLDHEVDEGVARVFNKAKLVLPHINFASAEPWSVLSYNPGGHYAPHYDKLHYEKKSDHDSWMNTIGNRFATFLIVLKTADRGGCTVFNQIDMTVQPEAGDVIFWQNENMDLTQHERSMHGACPIYEGQKIAATLWIRERGQSILERGDALMDHQPFLNPTKTFKCDPIDRCLQQNQEDVSTISSKISQGFTSCIEYVRNIFV